MLVKCTFSRYNYQLIVSSFKSDEHTHFFPPNFFLVIVLLLLLLLLLLTEESANQREVKCSQNYDYLK